MMHSVLCPCSCTYSTTRARRAYLQARLSHGRRPWSVYAPPTCRPPCTDRPASTTSDVTTTRATPGQTEATHATAHALRHWTERVHSSVHTHTRPDGCIRHAARAPAKPKPANEVSFLRVPDAAHGHHAATTRPSAPPTTPLRTRPADPRLDKALVAPPLPGRRTLHDALKPLSATLSLSIIEPDDEPPRSRTTIKTAHPAAAAYKGTRHCRRHAP